MCCKQLRPSSKALDNYLSSALWACKMALLLCTDSAVGTCRCLHPNGGLLGGTTACNCVRSETCERHSAGVQAVVTRKCLMASRSLIKLAKLRRQLASSTPGPPQTWARRRRVFPGSFACTTLNRACCGMRAAAVALLCALLWSGLQAGAAACPCARLLAADGTLESPHMSRKILQQPPGGKPPGGGGGPRPPLNPPPCHIASLVAAGPYIPDGPASQGQVDQRVKDTAWAVITGGSAAGGPGTPPTPGVGQPGNPNPAVQTVLGALLRFAFHDAGTYDRYAGGDRWGWAPDASVNASDAGGLPRSHSTGTSCLPRAAGV